MANTNQDRVIHGEELDGLLKSESDRRNEKLLESIDARLARMERLSGSALQRGEDAAESMHWMEGHLQRMNQSLARIADAASLFLERAHPAPRCAPVVEGEEWRPRAKGN